MNVKNVNKILLISCITLACSSGQSNTEPKASNLAAQKGKFVSKETAVWTNSTHKGWTIIKNTFFNFSHPKCLSANPEMEDNVKIAQSISLEKVKGCEDELLAELKSSPFVIGLDESGSDLGGVSAKDTIYEQYLIVNGKKGKILTHLMGNYSDKLSMRWRIFIACKKDLLFYSYELIESPELKKRLEVNDFTPPDFMKEIGSTITCK